MRRTGIFLLYALLAWFALGILWGWAMSTVHFSH